jgi:hypothetical protein
MRLEHIPLILGVLVGLLGLLLLADARLADTAVPVERRRRQRTERHRGGETFVALGVMCMAAALVGRDGWRYGTVAVIAGAVLILLGAALNWRFLHELFSFRGPARRAMDDDVPPPPRDPSDVRMLRPPERRKQPR